MAWYSELLSSLIDIDAQKNPVPALFLALMVCLLLWFTISQVRRRDTRRSARGDRDLSGWRSRQPPRS